jgi:hypothetical protein
MHRPAREASGMDISISGPVITAVVLTPSVCCSKPSHQQWTKYVSVVLAEPRSIIDAIFYTNRVSHQSTKQLSVRRAEW